MNIRHICAMIDTHYRIDIRPTSNRLDMTLRGFWSHRVAEQFAVELDCAIDDMFRAGTVSGRMRSMIDMSGLSILSRGLVPIFRDFATGQGRTCDRVAIIYGSVLALMQLKRIAADEPQYQFFRMVAEGEEWLNG